MECPFGLGERTRRYEVCYLRYQLQTLTPARWKYRLILTVDANFRMKNKARNIQNMPALGDGWAHFIPETLYCINMINSDGGVTRDTYVRK